MAGTAEHIVKSYEQELRHLRDLIARMGGLVESQLALATRAIVDGDGEAAARSVEQDPAVDALEREVEAFVIRLLALRQPVADDLREAVAALKITAALERIGDYAANVAKRGLVLARLRPPFGTAALATLARLVQENLRVVVDAVGARDAEAAVQVWRSDREIDELYTAIFRELITYMMEDPRSITACTHLLFIAKNLERIGDHATNIAENVHYAVTGAALTQGRPKGDASSAYAAVRPHD